MLLLTVDTLRPDALGWIGRTNSTPAIDALAASGFRFPRAIAPAPLTLPSHASMMTALHLRGHGVRDNGRVLPRQGPETLAERLRASGYDTAAFVSGFPLAAMFGLDRGFATYDDRFTGGSREQLERPAAETARAAAHWVRDRREEAKPWFLWIHFYDPHDPYQGRTGAEPAALRAAYDAEVRRVDQAIGGLMALLDARPRKRLTVFAADHGESLGEHGESTHGFFVYQSTVEVPLTFTFPGRVEPGESGARVGLVNLAPTVLDLVGLPGWKERDGASLARVFRGGQQESRGAIVESRRPWHSYGWAPLEAIVDGDWKLIAAPKPELYDLSSDPEERRNRIADERPVARRLERLLRAYPGVLPAEAQNDPETIARLRSLGYVGGSGAAGTPPPAGLADPKDRIETWNRLGAAEAALQAGSAAGALALFDEVLKEEPRNPFALARSAEALLSAGRFGEAEARLRLALEKAPEQAEVRFLLIDTLNRGARFAEAVPHWMELARQRPRDLRVWQGLGAALGRAGKAQEALRAFERAVEIDPANADARVRLAFAALGAGDKARAVSELERAARLGPAEQFAHAAALGILLDDLDRGVEAVEWLAQSRPRETEYAEARYRLALRLAASGDMAAARAALAAAVAADPNLAARARANPLLVGLQ